MERKVAIWGIGKDYELLRNILNNHGGNVSLEIIALISSKKESFNTMDGIDVIQPSEIKNYSYDYIIIANELRYAEILNQALKLDIQRKNILYSKVYKYPLFDVQRYFNILEGQISIISEDCWAGILYSSIGMEFLSPFINTAINREGYFDLITNPRKFLTQELDIVENGNIHTFPMGSLDGIDIGFYHYASGIEAKLAWERRMIRFNYNNYFIKMTLQNKEEAIRFSNLPIKNKIGLYYEDLQLPSIAYMKEWEDESIRKKYSYQFSTYVRANIDISAPNSKAYDILKILNNEDNYLRKQ